MVNFAPNKAKKGPGIRFLILFVVLSVVLITVWYREGDSGPLHSIRGAATVVTAPIESIGTAIAKPFTNIGDFFENLNTSDSEVEEIKAQNEELRAQLMELEEYRQENERLNSLLELQDAYSLDSTGARIIGTSTDSWNRTITLDKGTTDGIAVDMPVVNANGLIGQVVSVGPTSSIVRLIQDEQSGVAAMIQSSRVEGILSGSLDGLLYLNYISTSTEVVVGDVVITSGSGGVFPKGLPIGEVVSVEGDDSDLYYTIVVEPVTTVETYEEVLIVTGSQTSVTNTSSTEDTSTSSESSTTELSDSSGTADSTSTGSE